jgi:transposase
MKTMGLRGPRPNYDVGAFVLAVQMGSSKAELAAAYGITPKAVERRIHRLRVAGLLPPAPGRDRPMKDLAEARERREQQRRNLQERRRARVAARRATEERQAAERAREAEHRAAEEASRKRRQAELDWHAERERQQDRMDGPVLDLFLG